MFVCFLLGCGKSSPGGRPQAVATLQKSEQVVKVEMLSERVLALGKDAAVLVGNDEGGSLKYTGSGVVVDGGRAVLTNRHVVTGSDDTVDSLKLVLESGSKDVRLVEIGRERVFVLDGVKRDDPDYERRDLAVILLPTPEQGFLELSRSADLRETETLWGFSFPAGTKIRRVR